MVQTKPGQTPPLGQPFVEDLEFRKHRIKTRSISDNPIQLDCIYSMSVFAGNLDLPTWSIVNIPMIRPQDLRGLFGESTIRLIGYELPSSQKKRVHILKIN